MSSTQPTHEQLPSLGIKTGCSAQTRNCLSEKGVVNVTLKFPSTCRALRKTQEIMMLYRATVCCCVKQEVEVCLCGEE